MTIETLLSKATVPGSAGTPGEASHPPFVSSSLIILSSQVGRAVLALLAEVCYARLLGPAGRGQLSLALMVIAFGSLLGGMGGEIPIILWTAAHRDRPAESFPAVLFWGLLGSTVAVLSWMWLFWFWQPSFLKGITSPIAVLVAASIPIYILVGYAFAVFTGAERFKERAAAILWQQFITLAFVLLLIYVLRGAASVAVLCNLLGALATVALVPYLLRKQKLGNWGFSAARAKLGQTLSLGVRGQFGNLTGFFVYRLDVFLVNYFLGPASVGLYSLGVIVSQTLWQIPNAVSSALLPRTARRMEGMSAQFTCMVIRQTLVVIGLAGVALAIVSPWIIPLVFGAKFRASVAVVWWILPGTIALGLDKVACADLAGRGKPEYASIASLFALVLTVLMDVLLIPYLGINGAALTSSVSYLVETILVMSWLKKTLAVPWGYLLLPSLSDLAYYSGVFKKCKTTWRSLRGSVGRELL